MHLLGKVGGHIKLFGYIKLFTNSKDFGSDLDIVLTRQRILLLFTAPL